MDTTEETITLSVPEEHQVLVLVANEEHFSYCKVDRYLFNDQDAQTGILIKKLLEQLDAHLEAQ